MSTKPCSRTFEIRKERICSFLIEQLHRECIAVEQSPRDCRSIPRNHTIVAILREDLGIRIEQRSLQATCFAERPDVRQIGSDFLSSRAHPMARCACAFAEEERFAPGRIAGNTAASPGTRERAQVRDDGASLELGVISRRHGGAGNPCSNDLNEVVVRRSAPEFAVAEIDARNQIPFRAMAAHAVAAEKPPAVFNIRRSVAVLRSTLLPQSGSGNRPW